ncbi:hypothetical protein [Robertkochia solimangrovi]|uniref:hypothetical protein n=1 Tax=Robertkochia solimangrovi TaxID=2213046 RepID=UPI00117CC562|nr:hypothetical protein [Robertkochia solimangrovi]TRZ42431.1 hypothetical protein DMZ48_13025 [Robertkochia solimangrovi]
MLKKLTYFCLLLVLFSCRNDDDNAATASCTDNGSCDRCIRISNELYHQTNTMYYNIENASLNGDCLEITIGAGGCNGETWDIELVDSGSIIETGVPQRTLKIKFESSELCEAYLHKTISFNLKSIQLANYSEIGLLLSGYEDVIFYEY